jgi:alpha-L-rhamnosidase
MDRREFLRSGVAAGITLSLPTVAFLAGSSKRAYAEQEGEQLRAHMIWSSESVSIPLKLNGPSTSIASSSPDHPSILTCDLHTVFVRELTLETAPVNALVHLFSFTRYRLYINGVYQGRGPSRFQNQRPEYDTRELGHALRAGNNTIAVLVHRDAPTGRIMRHDPGFAAAIQLTHESHTQTFITDANWLSKPDISFGPREAAWSSIEENIDARKGFDLTSSSFSSAGWPSSILVGGPDFFPVWPRTTPLQIEISREWSSSERQLPISIQPPDEIFFDLPEIVQGYHELVFDADEGSELEVAYLLPQGERNGLNTYIARSGVQTYMGGDTFAQKRLSIRLRSGRVRLIRVAAIEVRYPFERAGSFRCSDPMLNRLWNICARSLEVLSEDSYVDCADRERVEWTDDSPPAFDCTRVMMRGPDKGGTVHWGDNRLMKSLLRRVALTQQPDGQIKAHSCSDRFDIHAIMEDRSCDWVILLRQYFESSSDKALVRELWPTLTRLMNWFLTRRTERGLVLAREWEVWDNPLRYQVCEGTGLNALVYRALQDGSYLGKMIGETADSKTLSTNAERLKDDLNLLLWNKDEGTYDGALFGPGSKMNTQLNGHMFSGPIVSGRYHPTAQAALFALYCQIVPPARVASVRSWLLSHINEITGPMSNYYLFHAMYRMENERQDSEILRLIRTAWANQVDSPWQTTWESLTDDGGSKVHMYGMVPGYFLTAFVLGGRRFGPIADQTIVIEPRCGDLSHAEGVAITEFGPVEINWSKDIDGVLSIGCTIPHGVKATLRLYRSDKSEFILINHQRSKATPNGGFIEAPLLPGVSQIQYPA